MASFSRLEIAGFVLLALGALFAVLSTTTTYWQTQRKERIDPTKWQRTVLVNSAHGGLFKICSTSSTITIKDKKNTTTYQLEKCMSIASSSSMTQFDNSEYDAVRAMMISTVICVLVAILLFLVFKNRQKDPAIPVVISGITAAIFCIAGVALYKKFLHYQLPKNVKPPKSWENSRFAPKLGWSFYLACVTPVLLVVSSVLLAVNWKFCSKSDEQPRSERHLMKTRS